jgi:mRNA interferase ChpB
VQIRPPPELICFLKKKTIILLTSFKSFARVAGFTVDLVDTKTVGVARCDQPRVLDLVARKAKKLESVSVYVMDEVLAKLSTLIA